MSGYADVHPAIELLLRKPTVGASDYIFAPDDVRKPDDAFGDDFRVLDHVGAMGHHPRSQNFPIGKLDFFPDPPLVLAWQFSGIWRLDDGAL